MNDPQYPDSMVSFVDYGFLAAVNVAINLVIGISVVLSCSCGLFNRNSDFWVVLTLNIELRNHLFANG